MTVLVVNDTHDQALAPALGNKAAVVGSQKRSILALSGNLRSI
jgi:hypothetical protein